ncbi:DUF4124 domain-containing protein [Aliikangiella marina]|uniref:DUF4124 domain-containing protein n=1 Tax=Aliikangiella marina TaxID=1712262 RepID=A0A545T8W1_9GAMM|nr:DUF4124 domain-containing protein [Aliikangiella marina]TQV73660.1 DUF4124 domain-containing protein [Aliikangiella marina]
MSKRILTIVALLAASLSISAGEKKKLYKWVDENGNVHYSDEPHKGAEELEIKEVPTIKMDTPPVQITGLESLDISADPDDFQGGYSVARLSEPLNNSVVRNNAGAITLSAQLSPPLSENHTIRFFLDGRPVSRDPKALTVTVDEQAYGEHSAYFVILNTKGKQLHKSETSNFNLLNMINPNIRKNRKGGN